MSFNDIKENKNVKFKTTYNLPLIKKLAADHNTHHLNQAHGSPFTIKPLKNLLGNDSNTPFA